MGFLAPLGLLLFGLAAPLIVLYLLKQKREDRTVSSTLLWRKVVDDIQARHPFQRLRANLLLLLQLLVLALCALALARPVVRATAERGRALAVVLDVSASMQAADADEGGGGGTTRFEAARDAAREVLRNLRGADRAMLVLAGRGARTAKALTSDRNELLRALAEARAEQTRGELRDAVVLAGAALKPFGEGGEVHVFSDGGGADALPSEKEVGAAIRFHRFGTGARNAGITGLDVVRGRDGRVEVFVTVENAGGERAKRFLVLHHEDQAVASKALDLAPASEESVVFREPLPPGRIAVRLAPGDGGGAAAAADVLPADDAAFAVLAPPERIGVAIVGTSHRTLERALEKAGDVDIYGGPLEAFRDDPKYRLVIYDGVEPKADALPQKPVLVFGARAALPGVKVGEEVEGPQIIGWERDHPLLRFVDLGGVAIARARPLALDGPGRPLIRSDRGLLALEARSRRDPLVAVGIDLRESTWATEEAFPVFVLNVLQMVRRAGGELGPDRIQTGEPLSVRAPAPEAAVAVVVPSGGRIERRAREGRADFLETGEAGFYRIEAPGGQSALVAANLLERTETRIAPRAVLDAGGKAVAAEAAVAPANREIWRWIVLAGLLALLAEWWVYHRRL